MSGMPFSMEDFDREAGLLEEEPVEEQPTDEAATEDEETPAEEDTSEEEEPSEEAPEESPDDEEGEEDEEEPEPEEASEESEEEDEGDEVPASDFDSPDPEVQAYLARFEGSVERALKGAVELQRVLGKQGREKGTLDRRVAELEAELAQARMFDGQSGPGFLSEEQQTWIGSALESGAPINFVRDAVQVGEFDLARALTDQWAEQQPYQAMRAAQLVDQAEQHAAFSQQQQAVESPPVYEEPEFVAALTQAYPDMPQFEPQMVSVVRNLGDGHPLVQASRSPDPQEAARGLVGIYEIARASSASVRSARETVKRKKTQDGRAARAAAQVTSGEASPAATEGTRPRMIAPGLTLEALDAEWERESAVPE